MSEGLKQRIIFRKPMKTPYLPNLKPLYAFGLLATTLVSQSAEITWGPAIDITDESDVSTNGTLVEAFNAVANDQIGDATTITVNGVPFAPTTSLLNQDPRNAGANDFSSTTDEGDPDYDTLVSTLEFGGGSSLVTLTLGDGDGDSSDTGAAGLLVIGEQYEIQVWYSDTRPNEDDRVTPVGDGNGNTVELNDQFAIGTFTADASTQEITLASPNFGQAHINAYQIRLATAVPTPPQIVITNAEFNDSEQFVLTATELDPTISYELSFSPDLQIPFAAIPGTSRIPDSSTDTFTDPNPVLPGERFYRITLAP